MASFSGFPARPRYVALPALFFSALLPQIHDAAELKVTLYVLALLFRRPGSPRCVGLEELAKSRTLLASLAALATPEEPPLEALERGLAAAVARGVLLPFRISRGDQPETIYVLNSPADRRAALSLSATPLAVTTRVAAPTLPLASGQVPPERPSIFALYEENIGVLTPLVAEELQEAVARYPASWIEEAIREAAALNRHNWRYIVRILERWATQGKDHGESAGDSYTRRWQEYLRQRRRSLGRPRP